MTTVVSGSSGITTQQVWHYVDGTTTFQYAYWGDYTTAYAQIGGYRDDASTGHLEFYTLTAGTPREQMRVLSTSGIQINGSTSGSVKLVPAAVAGTNTLTLPASTGTVSTTGFSVAMAVVFGG